MCESLEDENASKTVKIEQMKERIRLMERELGGLKSQLFAYTPLIVSLRESVKSLEQNPLFRTKLDGADNHKAKVTFFSSVKHELFWRAFLLTHGSLGRRVSY